MRTHAPPQWQRGAQRLSCAGGNSRANGSSSRKKKMKVEILYFEGCPNHKPAAERVRSILRDEGLSAEVSEIEVPDEAAARGLFFSFSDDPRKRGDIEPAFRGGQRR